MACEGRELASMPWCSQKSLLLSPPPKSGGDIGMVSVRVRASVCPWFPTIIWKNNHSIHFKFGLGICWVSVQNWFAWPNFGIHFKLGVYTYWVSVQKWFAFWPDLPNFGPLVATKWLKMVVSDHNLEEFSRKPIQTCCLHLLSECSEFICFLPTLAKFWSSSGHKVTEMGGFWPLSEIVFMQSNSNVVCTLIGCVFRIDLLFGHVGQILPF